MQVRLAEMNLYSRRMGPAGGLSADPRAPNRLKLASGGHHSLVGLKILDGRRAPEVKEVFAAALVPGLGTLAGGEVCEVMLNADSFS